MLKLTCLRDQIKMNFPVDVYDLETCTWYNSKILSTQKKMIHADSTDNDFRRDL